MEQEKTIEPTTEQNPQTEKVAYQFSDNTPEYIKKRLATAKPKKLDAEQPSEPLSGEKVEQSSEPNPTVEPAPTSEKPEPSKEQNDANAWKGRLTQEQAAHKATSDKLLAEAQARQKAEAEAKASQEKLATLEKQLAEKQAENAQATRVNDDFTDAELSEIEFALGATGRKLLEKLRNQPQTPAQSPDVDQVVEQRLNQWQQQQKQQSQTAEFNKAVSEQVPELQGLMTNSAFNQFLHDKVVDYMGNTAAGLVGFIGREKRIDLVPKLKELVMEFNQSQQPPEQTITASPSSKSASVRSPKAKPKMTAKDIATKNMLARSGKTDELRRFLAKFDHN